MLGEKHVKLFRGSPAPISLGVILVELEGSHTMEDCKEQIRVTNSLIKRCFGELYEELEDKFYQVPACLPCLFPKYVGSSSPKITRAKRTIDFLSWEDG